MLKNRVAVKPRIDVSSLNVTTCPGALWEHFSMNMVSMRWSLLLALRLLADTYPGTSRREPLEAKLPGLLEIFERSQGASMTCPSSSASLQIRQTNAIP